MNAGPMPPGRPRQDYCDCGHPFTKANTAWRKCGARYITRDCRACRHLRTHLRFAADLREKCFRGIGVPSIEQIGELVDADEAARAVEHQMRWRRAQTFPNIEYYPQGSWLAEKPALALEIGYFLDCQYWEASPPTWLWCSGCEFWLVTQTGWPVLSARQERWRDEHRLKTSVGASRKFWEVWDRERAAAA
jgi:hypothetical protein